MFKILYPQLYVNTLLDIPLSELKKANIRAFILDLDNTVTCWNSSYVTGEIIDWFKKLKTEGFKACILSNNGERRVLSVAENLGIPYIHRAQKPRKGAFYRAVDLMGATIGETAVIGDQIFTDVLGGNRAGLYTILVVPISQREFTGTKISRFFEYWVKRDLKKGFRIPYTYG